MGSKSLQRAGHDVVAYDARGHGASDPAPSPDAYTYADLADDLLAVMDEAGFERAVLAGASMGAHTAVRVALEHPERVAGLVVVTPAYDPEDWPGDLARWDALSDGLRNGASTGSSRPTATKAPRSGARRCRPSCASAWARTSTPRPSPTR